ncbi:MAG: minor capsid protein [Sphingomonas sp.]
MNETDLIDAIIRQALELERIAAGDQAEAIAVLRELERQLAGIAASGNITSAGKRQIDALIREADEAIAASYARLGSVVDVPTLLIHVAEGVETILAPLTGGAKLLADAKLASLADNVLLEGTPLRDWWKGQEQATARQFAAQVRQGAANNETVDRIVQRIVGKGAEPGIMQVTRRHARTLVHSSVMAAANDAAMASYRKASKYIAGVRWLATLDSHTCKQCAALDGQAWDLDGNKLEGTRVDFTSAPAHASCRCVLSPIPKRSGATADFAAIGDRVSSKGLQPRGTTFAEFFGRMTPAEQDEQFGPKYAQLMRDGEITVRDLVSRTGRELKLSELRKR